MLINRLLGVKGLARTSSTPGRTRAVNFYRINESFQFVDLPGYGYARVPEGVRRSWKPIVESFLDRRRERIVLAVLLADARHRPTELDRTMRDWLSWREIAYLIVATKADKLSGNGRAAAARVFREDMGSSPHTGELVLASATTGLGIREIWRHLDKALAAAESAWTG